MNKGEFMHYSFHGSWWSSHQCIEALLQEMKETQALASVSLTSAWAILLIEKRLVVMTSVYHSTDEGHILWPVASCKSISHLHCKSYPRLKKDQSFGDALCLSPHCSMSPLHAELVKSRTGSASPYSQHTKCWSSSSMEHLYISRSNAKHPLLP